jgi:hypothetical protein
MPTIYDDCINSDEKTLEDIAKSLGVKGLDFKKENVKETFCRVMDGLATGGEAKAEKAAARFLRTI